VQEEKIELRRMLFALLLKLLKEYNYKEEQIALDVFFNGGIKAEMVVYRDLKHEEPFIAVILDAMLTNELISRAEALVREIPVEYCILGDTTNLKIFKVQRDGLIKVEDIPFWIGNNPLAMKVSKSKVLPPFRDEYSLRRVVYKCHTILYENSGHDPSKAFDELIKIIFLKFYDEQDKKEEYYRFVVFEGERPEHVKDRIKKLLHDAQNLSLFSKIFNSNSLDVEISDFALYEIVLELQGFSFTETTKTIDGIDVMGRIYEQIVDRTFRGGLGQYYTPRTIAEFMIDFLGVDIAEKVLDPACGTGGFLTMCINRILNKLRSKESNVLTSESLLETLRNYINSNLYGVDIFDRICRVARMNLLFHGGTDPKIFNMNGLLVDECAPEEFKGLFQKNSFQKIFSNPPFAGIVKDSKILSKFKLGKRNGKISSITPEVLFIEKIVELLDYGGKAGLVLPLGIFNNPSLKFVREFLFKNTRILGVVGLPDFAFTHTGTSVKGALLFIEKVPIPERDYKIFMTVANNIGYDSTGRPTERNDLPKLVEAYKNHESNYFISFSEIKDRIDAQYYLPYYKELEEKVKSTPYPMQSIYDVVEVSNNTINPRMYPEKEFLYIETSSVNLKEGKIIKIKKFLGRKAPSRAKYLGRAGDILIPTARESLVGVLLLPRRYDGIIVSSRFIVCKPKEHIVRPLYLYYILKNRLVLELLKRECVGEIVPSISESALKNVFIPVPPHRIQDEIIKQLKEIKAREKELKRKMRVLKEQTEKLISTVFSGATSKNCNWCN
ncbi:MAG: N-6 DNA methylase, partial [Candidatus Bathyarchaeia archaeon]